MNGRQKNGVDMASKYQFENPIEINPTDKPLGRGGSATVYKKPLNGKIIACKVARVKKNHRNLNEISLLVWINEIIPENDYLLEFYGYSHAPSTDQLYFEYMDGRDLRSFIDRNKRYQLDNCLSFILQIARGLELLDIHDIVHRDIKSENILTNLAGQAKIGDFGLAAFEHELQGQSVVYGTLDYIAPEIISYFATLDGTGEKNRTENNPPLNSNYSTDIYAFGLVIWELLTREELVSDIFDAKSYCEFVKKPENLRKHDITATSPAPQQKMASLYKWCCLFDPKLRPTASDIIRECELGEVISEKLKPFAPN